MGKINTAAMFIKVLTKLRPLSSYGMKYIPDYMVLPETLLIKLEVSQFIITNMPA